MCSSDLPRIQSPGPVDEEPQQELQVADVRREASGAPQTVLTIECIPGIGSLVLFDLAFSAQPPAPGQSTEIGRASCRERV